VTFGTEQFSPNNLLEQDILEVTENLTIPYGAHTFTLGGRIENTDVVSFALGVTARTRAGTETFRAVQGYDDDEVVRWDAPLTVVPASADAAPSEQPRRAIVAGAVGLLVIGVSLLFLWRARRGPLQER
jgi:hypothetical protein